MCGISRDFTPQCTLTEEICDSIGLATAHDADLFSGARIEMSDKTDPKTSSTGEADLEALRMRMHVYESFDSVISENIANAKYILVEAAELRERVTREITQERETLNAEIRQEREALNAEISDKRARLKAEFVGLRTSFDDELQTRRAEFEHELEAQRTSVDDELKATKRFIEDEQVRFAAAQARLATTARAILEMIEGVPASTPTPNPAQIPTPAPTATSAPTQAPPPTQPSTPTSTAPPAPTPPTQAEVITIDPPASVVEPAATSETNSIPQPDQPSPNHADAPTPSADVPSTPGTDPARTTIIIHGIYRPVIAAGLQRFLLSKDGVISVEPREFAEGILRLQIRATTPITEALFTGWAHGEGMTVIQRLPQTVEIVLPTAG